MAYQILVHSKNIKSVALFNRIAYNWPVKCNDANYGAIVRKQVTLCLHEIEELEENLNIGGCIRDDICDILYVAYGLAYRVDRTRELNNALKDYTVQNSGLGVDNIVSVLKQNLKLVEQAFLDCRDEVSVDLLAGFIKLVEGFVAIEGITTAQEDFNIVAEANLAKFDGTLEDAELTKEKYAAKGIETSYRIANTDGGVQFFATMSSKDQVVDGKEYPEGKVLKSHKWTEPSFREA